MWENGAGCRHNSKRVGQSISLFEVPELFKDPLHMHMNEMRIHKYTNSTCKSWSSELLCCHTSSTLDVRRRGFPSCCPCQASVSERLLRVLLLLQLNFWHRIWGQLSTEARGWKPWWCNSQLQYLRSLWFRRHCHRCTSLNVFVKRRNVGEVQLVVEEGVVILLACLNLSPVSAPGQNCIPDDYPYQNHGWPCASLANLLLHLLRLHTNELVQ